MSPCRFQPTPSNHERGANTGGSNGRLHAEANVALARAAKPLSAAATERLRERAQLELARLEPWKNLPEIIEHTPGERA